ncbi:hypothetical protein GFS24_07875 [Chitinophaga sp. SYP-B3965]|uniref:hypothetical protein n=1 Tax=Chitinophaga sp. SYP-B3965 TaxID=2663120 RepID=UPI0012996F83|nr:hypothetical protein [Chitinophaga sp. SYP-B3965]MRG45028.1 hypothetical protein [Chitinophaga sp. SYP-B3965]
MKQVIFCLLFANTAFAQTACPPWVATLETRNNSTPAFRNAVLAIEKTARDNPHFNSITPARFRTSMTMGGGYAQINVKAYSQKGWDDKCGIIPQADRIAADDAGISFNINKTGPHYTSLEDSPVKDEKLDAFKEPVSTKTIGGQPLYYESMGNHFLLITYNGEVPWEPVTTAEYLDFIERRLQRLIQDHKDQNKLQTFTPSDPLKNGYYLELKKTKPKEAEEFIALAEKMNKEMAVSIKKANEMIATGAVNLQKDLDEFRALRATYSAEDLKKQALRGHSKFGLYTGEYPNSKAALVKIKKEFLLPDKIRLITIWAAGTILDWNERIQKALETLDYKAIRQVMYKG